MNYEVSRKPSMKNTYRVGYGTVPMFCRFDQIVWNKHILTIMTAMSGYAQQGKSSDKVIWKRLKRDNATFMVLSDGIEIALRYTQSSGSLLKLYRCILANSLDKRLWRWWGINNHKTSLLFHDNGAIRIKSGRKEMLINIFLHTLLKCFVGCTTLSFARLAIVVAAPFVFTNWCCLYVRWTTSHVDSLICLGSSPLTFCDLGKLGSARWRWVLEGLCLFITTFAFIAAFGRLTNCQAVGSDLFRSYTQFFRRWQYPQSIVTTTWIKWTTGEERSTTYS